MKKVLVVNTKYREYGGEDSNILDEIKILKKDYFVHYLEFDNKYFRIIDIFSIIFGINPKSIKRLNLAIKDFQPDVIYVHNLWYKAGLGIINTVINTNIPIVHKIHNYRTTCSRYFLARNHLKGYMFCYACNFRKKRFTFFNKYYENSYLKSFLLTIFSKQHYKLLKTNNLKVVVLSEFHKKYLEKQGLSGQNITILFNPISTTHNLKEVYNLKSNYIVYAGRLSEEKGVNELIQSWKDSSILGLKLKIAGFHNLSKQDLNNLKNYNIEYLGQLPNDELQILIRSSRAVVTATKLFEGQPRLLFEALSNSIPAIFPNFGGMPEFFPTNYSFKFNQFDYLQLTNIINKLNDENLLEYEHERFKDFFEDKFSENVYLSKFQNLVF